MFCWFTVLELKTRMQFTPFYTAHKLYNDAEMATATKQIINFLFRSYTELNIFYMVFLDINVFNVYV